MNATFQFLARTGRRLRSFIGKIVKHLAENGRFTLKLTVKIPLFLEVEAGIELDRKKPR